MSCTTNYPLQFEASKWKIYVKFEKNVKSILVPNDDQDDVDTVFMPIKSNDDDEPVRALFIEKKNIW